MMLLAMALGAGAGVSGCSKTSTSAPSQLAAKMGSDEVTLYELDRVAAHRSAGAEAHAAASRKRILDQLIDEHLMADEAIRLKLDRTPDAVLDLQLCKQSTLQNAYLMSIFAQRDSSAVTDKRDAQAYYDQHPELFAQRQVYLIKEIVFPQNAGLDLDAAGKLAPADLLALLEQRAVKYRVTFGKVGTDELSPQLQKATGNLKDGQSMVVPMSDDLVMVERISAAPAPVDFDAAEPGIVAFLGRRQAEQQLQAQAVTLRDRAGVQYLNEFASVDADSKSAQGRLDESRASIVAQ